LRKKWYPDGIKIIPNDLILTRTICLYWYIGDGGLIQNYKNETTSELILNTNSFSSQEIDNILLPQMILYNAYKRPKKNGYVIVIPRKSINLFFDFIGECPIDEYKHKWNVLGEDSFFKESAKTDWFGIFHKSIRQTDFFQECYRKIKEPQLTDLEEKEFKFLRNKIKGEGYDKTDPTGKFMFNEEYRRYCDLSLLKQSEQYDKSIGGHLDMILWNTIHVDKNELYNTFLRTFSEYKLQQNEKGSI
jgi:hypothetical protein